MFIDFDDKNQIKNWYFIQAKINNTRKWISDYLLYPLHAYEYKARLILVFFPKYRRHTFLVSLKSPEKDIRTQFFMLI